MRVEQEVLAVIRPTIWRRTVAIGALTALGVLMVWLAFGAGPAALVWKVIAIGAGCSVLVLVDRLRRATAVSLELTASELRESSGRVLCRTDQIVSIDRSAFAFKPSNGLLVRLDTAQPLAWAPGLWWRFGKRIGIGGVTSAAEAKFMAEAITLMLMQRRGEV